MRAVFTNGSFIDSVTFYVTVGTRATTDPTGPDSYGYIAYDNTDSLYSAAQRYNWIDITTNTANRLSLTDASEASDASLVMRLPFQAMHYGLTYDSITVCTNGWFAFGAQPQYNNMRPWHLPANEGPRNICAVFWIDLIIGASPNGVFGYYDEGNHRYILTWKGVTNEQTEANEFQAVIFDPRFYPTPSGDASLLFQYKTFNPSNGPSYPSGVDGGTIGIADNTYTRGLEYLYWLSQYTPGSSPITEGTNANRAIFFTTSVIDTALRVLGPSGDSIGVGTTTTIRWRGRPGITAMNIDINRNFPSGTWERLISNTLNDGSESWMTTGPQTTTARFRVMSLDSTAGDTSDVNTTIMFPNVVLTAPNGGENWQIGYGYSLNWTSFALGGTLTMQIDRNYPSGTWETIIANTPNDRAQVWLVSGPATTTARIRIFSDDSPTVGDTANANMTISTPALLEFTPNPLVRTVAAGDTVRSTVSLTNVGGLQFTGNLSSSCGVSRYSSALSTDPGGPVYRWVDVSAGINGPSSDNTTLQINLPFQIEYFGNRYSSVWWCSNGWLSLNYTVSSVAGNAHLPITAFSTMICPFFDDLLPSAGNTKYVIDTVNHRAIFSWVNCPLQSSTGLVNVQAILSADGSVTFQYGTMTVATWSQTIGVQLNSSVYTESFYNAAVSSNFAIRYSYSSRTWAIPSTLNFLLPAGSGTLFTVFWDARGLSNGDSVTGSFAFLGNTPSYTVPVTLRVGQVTGGVLVIHSDSLNIPSGSNYSMGNCVTNRTKIVTLTATNEGNQTMQFTGTTPVTTTGEFSVVSQPAVQTLAPQQSTTFSIAFTPTVSGTRSGTVLISSTDPNNNPYVINLVGVGQRGPSIPSNITVSFSLYDYSATVNWLPSSGWVGGYAIYRLSTPFEMVDTVNYTNLVGTVSSTTYSWVDMMSVMEPIAYYRITAYTPQEIADRPELARRFGYTADRIREELTDPIRSTGTMPVTTPRK